MTEKKSQKRRTQIKDLPQQEKELSKQEQKKVKGGVEQNVASQLASRGTNNFPPSG